METNLLQMCSNWPHCETAETAGAAAAYEPVAPGHAPGAWVAPVCNVMWVFGDVPLVSLLSSSSKFQPTYSKLGTGWNELARRPGGAPDP